MADATTTADNKTKLTMGQLLALIVDLVLCPIILFYLFLYVQSLASPDPRIIWMQGILLGGLMMFVSLGVSITLYAFNRKNWPEVLIFMALAALGGIVAAGSVQQMMHLS